MDDSRPREALKRFLDRNLLTWTFRLYRDLAREMVHICSVAFTSACDFGARRAMCGGYVAYMLDGSDCLAKIRMINFLFHAREFGEPNGSCRYRKPGAHAAAIRFLLRREHQGPVLLALHGAFCTTIATAIWPLGNAAVVFAAALGATAAMAPAMDWLGRFTAYAELEHLRQRHPAIAAEVDIYFAAGLREIDLYEADADALLLLR